MHRSTYNNTHSCASLVLQVVFTEEEREELALHVKQVLHSFVSYFSVPIESNNAAIFGTQINKKNHNLSTGDVAKQITEWQEHGKGIQKLMRNYMTQLQVLMISLLQQGKLTGGFIKSCPV